MSLESSGGPRKTARSLGCDSTRGKAHGLRNLSVSVSSTKGCCHKNNLLIAVSLPSLLDIARRRPTWLHNWPCNPCASGLDMRRTLYHVALLLNRRLKLAPTHECDRADAMTWYAEIYSLISAILCRTQSKHAFEGAECFCYLELVPGRQGLYGCLFHDASTGKVSVRRTYYPGRNPFGSALELRQRLSRFFRSAMHRLLRWLMVDLLYVRD